MMIRVLTASALAALTCSAAQADLRDVSVLQEAGRTQLCTHEAGNGAANDTRDDREDQVKRADILVVGRHEPAGDEARLVVRIVMVVRIIVGLEGVSGGSHVARVLFGSAVFLSDCSGWKRRQLVLSAPSVSLASSGTDGAVPPSSAAVGAPPAAGAPSAAGAS